MAKKLASSQVTITDMTDVTEAANAAKTTAESTAAHFWFDTEGAHVTHTEEGEAISGGNTLITEDGMEVRDGNTTLSEFSADGVIIGKDGTQKVLITGAEFKAVSGEGEVSARIASMRSKDAKEITEAPSLTVVYGESKTHTPSFTPEPGTKITIKFKLARSGEIKIATRTFTAGKSDGFDSGYENVLVAANGSVTMHYYKAAAPNSSLTLMTMTYTTKDSDDTALMSGSGTFKADWDGNITAAGLVNKTQAGSVLLTPGSSTVTYNGVKYYEVTGNVTFDTPFDAAPHVILSPSTSVPHKMAVAPSDITETGFTINFFRDSKTATGIHWIAMGGTQ